MSDGLPNGVVTTCDECGAHLTYPGNRGIGDERWCDGCYDRIQSMRR